MLDCVNYSGEKEKFNCLTCQCDLPAIPSKSTLIITPFIISQQWIDEINKHSRKKLNILFYKGSKAGYVQPKGISWFNSKKVHSTLNKLNILKIWLIWTFALQHTTY